MVTNLSKNERSLALVLTVLVVLLGLTLGLVGRNDVLGVHGALITLVGVFLIFNLADSIFDDEPEPGRLAKYYDEPTKFGIIIAMVWVIFATFIGDWVAWLLVFPEATFDAGWSSFGRLRPVHTTGVIFGFGGNALIATSFHVLQRTTRARLPDHLSPWVVIIGYNLFCLLAVTGYLMGITSSKEYAEPEWYADLILLAIWVLYFGLYIRTLARRKEPHIYVANWYFLAFIVVVAILHIINNLAVPISFGHAKSYTIFSGVQDAMTQWWYGHNAVAFFLTAGFLGMLYYYLPKRAERPIFSYRLSIVSFWGITFFYMWAGSHHLHYTALPDWAQSLGMVLSLILLAPSWGGMINGMMTLSGAWGKLRTDPTLRFLVVSLSFYGMSTFEGPMMAIKTVNSLSHYTDWTIGHVHSGALGWVAMVTIGALYHLFPLLYNRKQMYSISLIHVHFWLSTIGIVLYIASMWVNGILQGLMWRAYNADGTLTYSFVESVEASYPGYYVRLLGGVLFFSGMLIMAYNVWRTIKGDVSSEDVGAQEQQPAAAAG